MDAAIDALNKLDRESARPLLTRCCGAARWVDGMVAARPFADPAALFAAGDRVWAEMAEADWLEAFAHHPQIGGVDSLRAKFASTQAWSAGEQASVAAASEEVIQDLAAGNRAYAEKFGFIFIVCATGKSATEMRQLLQERLPNDRATELRIAAEEQRKIMQLRLAKLLDELNASS